MRYGKGASSFFSRCYFIHAASVGRLLIAAVTLASFFIPALSFAQQGKQRTAKIRAAAHAKAVHQQKHHVVNYDRIPLSFEANQGQASPRVKFLARGPGYTLFLTGNEAKLRLIRAHKPQAESSKHFPQLAAAPQHRPGVPKHPRKANLMPALAPSSPQAATFLHIGLKGANPNAPVAGLDELPGKSNYYIGNNPKKWHTGIPTYARVRYQNIYPGIDLVYHGRQQQLEYDFQVAPGANPNRIQLDFKTSPGGKQASHKKEQTASPRIAGNGDLVIKTRAGEVRFHPPVVYQTSATHTGAASAAPSPSARRKYIKAGYVLERGHNVGFRIASYNHARPLVIDPVLAYATYADLGGSNGSQPIGIGVDGSGDAYVADNAGGTASGQIAIREFSPQGNTILYTTFFGGSGVATAFGMAVDSAGDVYFDGQAGAGLPTTNGAYRASCSGTCSSVAFAAKLSTGGTLSYATYMGGSNSGARAIAINSSGDAFIAGEIDPYSTDLQLVNPYQKQSGPIFLQELNPTGSQLLYSSYFGNSTSTATSILIAGIALDGSGNIYVAGNGPVPLKNPLEQGVGPIFLSKFTPDGSSLLYSTQLGGSAAGPQPDTATGLAVDSSGDAYVTGYTWSRDFPVTMKAFKASCFEAGAGDCQSKQVFVTKVDPNGTSLLYSTLIGPGWAGGIAVDSAGDAWITGRTSSYSFPIIHPIESGLRQTDSAVLDGDAYLTRLDPSGIPDFSTYLGGAVEDDAGIGVAVDQNGNAYVVGVFSTVQSYVAVDFPIVNPAPGVEDSVPYSTPFTMFTAKVNPSAPGPAISLSPVISPLLQLRNVSSSPLAINSITGSSTLPIQGDDCGSALPPGGGCSIVVNPTNAVSYYNAGTLTVSSNAPGSPQQFNIYGSIWPASNVFATPAHLEFPAQLVGTAGAPQTITLTNLNYPTPLGINYIGLSSVNTGTGNNFNQTNDCPASLPAGDSCHINVQFMPAAGSDGDLGNQLDILTNDSNFTYFATIGGVRQNESIIASAKTVQFGIQEVGATPLPRVVTLTNTSNQPVSVGSVSVTAPFTQTNNCTSPLAPHASCRVAVTLIATSNWAGTGQLTANFSGQGSPATVSLVADAQVPADIDVSPYSLQIGGVLGTSSTAYVTLKNVSSSTVALSSFALTPSSFTETNTCNGSLAAGAQCTVNVTFTPTSLGELNGTLTISFSGMGSPQIVPLTGTTVLPLQVTPTSLTFGPQAPGTTSASQGVLLSNQVTATSITINSINVSGDFKLVKNNCPGTLTPQYNCNLQMAFAPTVTGTLTGTLSISASDSSTPHTVALSGTGANLPAASLSPASLTFNALESGYTSQPQTVTLKNDGTATLTISSIQALGDFAQTNTCGSSVAAGANCTISVTFSPTAGGNRTGSIAIVDNAPDNPQSVALTGTGSDFNLAPPFGDSSGAILTPGQTMEYPLELTPLGGFNKTVSLKCTGAPANATCTVSPSSVTLDGTLPQNVKVTITTTAPSLLPPASPKSGPPATGGLGVHEWWMALLMLIILGTLALASRRRRVPLLAGALLLAALAMSCGGGGGGGGSSSSTPSTPGTPTGTYTLTVTGTSGTLTHKTTAPLVVH